jgi:T4-like virus Myoviridae tail sheath stabiliser
MFGQQFYFQTIRKYVALFGTLFNDIHIARTNKSGQVSQYIKVPITYSAKEKMLARLQQDPNIDRPSATITMPVMSFEMTSISYDADRKLNTIGRSAFKDTVNGTNKLRYQYNPVAYNIGFRLYIMVKNAEDGTKIVEQILPYFTPDFTTTIMLIPEINEKKDIPVILNSISQQDEYEGNFTERRHLTWTLDFTLKGYIYGPVKKTAVIKYANNVFYTPSVVNLQDAVGQVEPVSYVQIQPGLTANGQPTSNAANSIPVGEIEVTDDFGYVIEKTDIIP